MAKISNWTVHNNISVRGKANAGGVGFVVASDIVLADQTAQFSLSELLFGLFPALVLPFLIRRIGFQKAHCLTLMIQPISVEQAYAWGLVDACDVQSESLLRKHLLRLRRLSKMGIIRYKRYMSRLYDWLLQSKSLAVAANREVFSDPRNLEWIFRYAETGQISMDGLIHANMLDSKGVGGKRVTMIQSVVDLHEVEPGIVQVTMQDRVHKNTFTEELILGLSQSFESIQANSSYKVVILTGYDSYFASGGTQEGLLAIHEGKAKFSDTKIYSLALAVDLS